MRQVFLDPQLTNEQMKVTLSNCLQAIQLVTVEAGLEHMPAEPDLCQGEGCARILWTTPAYFSD